MVKLEVNLSNSERVEKIETVIEQRLEGGAEDSPAFRKIVCKALGFSPGEMKKAKAVIDTNNPDFILRMNKAGLTSGWNQVKPKEARKRVERKYSLSAKSSDIMRFVRHRYYNGQSIGDVIEMMFNDWAEDYIKEYRSYTAEELIKKFDYKNNGDEGQC